MSTITPFLLHERFIAQARATPDAVALVEGGRSITFEQLRALSGRIAGGLRDRGAREGSLVGVHLERSIESVGALLGTLEAGAAVVPLPPGYPEAHLRRVVDAASPAVILDDERTPFGGAGGAGASSDDRVVRLAELASSSATDVDAPAGEGDPDRPAFVLGSSGSTGHPKLIVRSHASFGHRLLWTWGRHPFTEGELGCQKAHATTTHGVYELFEPLLAGAPVLIVPDEKARDLEQFWGTVSDRGVTRLLIVPSALRASLDMPDFRAPPLKVVVLMGEYVPPDLARRAVEAFSDSTHLYSIYGSTEASSTLVVDLRESLPPHAELPLGVPIRPEVQARVLGSDLRPVAEGETGRLYISGPPLFTAYLGDPERTESVLVESPDGGGPLYDTRDRVRFLPDGALHFVGRVDDMVKVRGFLVDLPEVERALAAHPGVRQAAVVLGGEDGGEGMLIGFFTPADLEPDLVYRTLRERLPAHMVPSVLRGLDEFPLTRSAKVDRVRLAAEYRDRREAPPDPTGLTATGRRVAEIWGEALGHVGFRPDDSFFEVGGTSLTVYTLVHRLRDEFGLDASRLTGKSVYRFPTLSGQAAAIDELLAGRAPEGGEADDSPLVTLRRATDPDLPPLFVIASAGGTLGAYEKLAGALATDRAVVGVRDPYLWGARDPGEGFDRWVDRYLDGIRTRQSDGPYYLCAYSSAGAFGWEIACRLSDEGRQVALLALVEPIGLDRLDRRRFGYWAFRAIWMRRQLRWLVRLAGLVYGPVFRVLGAPDAGSPPSPGPSDAEVLRIAESKAQDRDHILNLAALLELNTGLPFMLTADDLAGLPPDRALEVLQDRVAELTPGVDPQMIERLAIQYEVQVRTQHAYRLRPYDGRVLLVEPPSRHQGLLARSLRPFAREVRRRVVEPDPPSERMRQVGARFGALATHYRSMRDDGFVRGLAKVLEEEL